MAHPLFQKNQKNLKKEEPETEDDSMETDQPQEDSVEAEATGDFHLTDDDLSDTKDENVFSFLPKTKNPKD